MEVAVREVRQPLARDDREEVPAAADLPEIHELLDEAPPVPEIPGVRVELAHLVRMARDRHGAARADLPQQLDGIAVRGQELLEAERQDVHGGIAIDRVAGHLGAGQHEHSVGPPRAVRLARDLVAVPLPALAIERAADRVRDAAEPVVPVDDVVRDGDDVVARKAEEVHDLGKGHRPVRVGRVDVKIAKQHARHPIRIVLAGREARGRAVRGPRKEEVRFR